MLIGTSEKSVYGRCVKPRCRILLTLYLESLLTPGSFHRSSLQNLRNGIVPLSLLRE